MTIEEQTNTVEETVEHQEVETQDGAAEGQESEVEGGEHQEAEAEGAAPAVKAPQIDYATFDAEKEKRIRLEAELEFTRRQSQQQPDPRAAQEAREEKERLALMTPEERATYTMHKEISQLKQQQQSFMLMQQFQNADAADRNNYLSVATGADARRSELYSKNMGEVEKRLAEYRKNGVYPTREEVLKLVLGEQAISAVAKGPNKGARQAAQNRVISTTGKPVATPNKSSAAPGKKSAESMSLSELKQKAISDWKAQKGVN